MRRHGLSFLAVLLLVGADTPNQLAEKADTTALQGTWVLQTVEWLGEKTYQNLDEIDVKSLMNLSHPEKRGVSLDLKNHRTTLAIKGDRCVYRHRVHLFGGRQKIVSEEGKYRLDVTRNPRVMARWATAVTYQFDDDWGNEVSAGKEGGPYYYIYSLKGDTLQWGMRGRDSLHDLPATFATEQDEAVVVLTFQREKE